MTMARAHLVDPCVTRWDGNRGAISCFPNPAVQTDRVPVSFPLSPNAFPPCTCVFHGTAHVSTHLFSGERFWPENINFVPSGLKRALMIHSGPTNSPTIDRSVDFQNVSGEL